MEEDADTPSAASLRTPHHPRCLRGWWRKWRKRTSLFTAQMDRNHPTSSLPNSCRDIHNKGKKRWKVTYPKFFFFFFNYFLRIQAVLFHLQLQELNWTGLGRQTPTGEKSRENRIESWDLTPTANVVERFGNGEITEDGDCSHEIKRRLLLGRKVMTNLDSILKSRDITLPTKVHLVKAIVFPVVMYGCESWTVKKA